MFRSIFKCVDKVNRALVVPCIRGLHSTAAICMPKRTPSGPAVVLSDDGETIFCWHPEQQFPYEHTKPLPRNQEENEMGESVLKVQHFDSRKLGPDGPTDRELMEMFNTNIYPWRFQPQKRKIKPNPPKDRDSI